MSVEFDDLIKQRAAIYAEKISAAASKAKKEEEIRIASERELAFLEDAAKIKLEGQQFTVASGYVDSVYDRVIIEYKNPSSASARLGPSLDSPGTKKVVEQIQSRFADLGVEQGQPLNSLFGVGLDGRYFVLSAFATKSGRSRTRCQLLSTQQSGFCVHCSILVPRASHSPRYNSRRISAQTETLPVRR